MHPTKPTRTYNRLHFTDLDPRRFEDLCMQLVYRYHKWEDIHHDGRTGSDDGVDIRALERLDDGSLRHWSIQCKRYQDAGPKDLKNAMDECLAKTDNPPEVILLAIGCDVSKKARDEFEAYIQACGIETGMLWTASKLETFLYSDHPDLLFAFFGVSMARLERGRETGVKQKLAMKRKLGRILKPEKGNVIIRSIDDDMYPEVDTEPVNGMISGWFKVEFWGFYHNGIEIILSIKAVVVGNGHYGQPWAIVPDKALDTVYTSGQKDGTLAYGVIVDANHYKGMNAFVIGRIPYRNIIECDDEGDEYYPYPHLYCKFADQGTPYEAVVYRLTEIPCYLDKDQQLDFEQLRSDE